MDGVATAPIFLAAARAISNELNGNFKNLYFPLPSFMFDQAQFSHTMASSAPTQHFASSDAHRRETLTPQG